MLFFKSDYIIIAFDKICFRKDEPLIYCLVDPRDNEIRYIGKSICGINRAYQHLTPSSLKNDGNTRKSAWIKSLLKKGLKPKIFILKSFPLITSRELINEYLYTEEHNIIKHFREIGYDLYNSTDGGIGALGRKVSEETREKMRKSSKTRPLPEALRLNCLSKYGPPIPKKKRIRLKKGTLDSYINSLKKKVIGVNLTTNNRIEFSSVSDCETYFRLFEETKRFNRKYLRDSIKMNKPYYGYIWEFEKCQ